jgi:hypothetical protein
MKKVITVLVLTLFLVISASSCKKTETQTGASLTGTWTKPGPSGSGINFQLIMNDATKTTQIGYNTGTPASFTQTGTGSYTRTDSQISLTSSVTCPGVVGVYNFTVNSTTLSMTVVGDACTDGTSPRSTVVGGNWTRQ